MPYVFKRPKIKDVLEGFTSAEALSTYTSLVSDSELISCVEKIAFLASDTLTPIKHWDHDYLSNKLSSIYPDPLTEDPREKEKLEDLKRLGVKKKDILRGIRWAITGMKDGPALIDTMLLIGKVRVWKRLFDISEAKIPQQKP
ncbi:hypothetical protein CPB83DRAFT_369995 [Crepidotus variabilis]|uniref:Aminoacyl-tRNA synthetase class I anticodon-binding domain-containing protein n=1 Tax=Crepidotus variabilis TaxID=179855 RepID=A0A9P6EF22_9AGAR|nr:hypothetical protein CPB83DRAFT_369995 [Crepidotus variabilis]